MALDENTTDSTNPALDSTNPLYMHPSESVGSMLEFWKELEDRYNQTNGAKLYQLQREINDLSQGTLDITGYYTRIKKLWEELNTLNAHAQCKCNCTCGAKANMQKAEQDRRLIQFLMGLNEVYTVVRGSILMMNPLPSLAQAFSILIQEEKQREVKPNNQLVIESTALSANRSGGNHFRTNFGQQTNVADNTGYMNYNQQGNRTGNNNYRGGQFGNRPQPFCDYCKKPGHTKERCYKLHGYPQDSTFNKGKRIAANVHGSQREGVIEGGDGNSGPAQEQDRTMQNLTKEQYNQLVSILENFHARNAGNKMKA
ncbi:PREDICTED: uncharacterized protein LOC109239092 [Nicotiana attenuata]|uniref:uncharacterized protein LOC109239092 n=1 Tax=Nicotiana attenuata TaxID=49451 RepID=UPI000904F6A0|nr:PREDICTED: uncharacterized protein LOC109239092 [Nicotiana attenuata]